MLVKRPGFTSIAIITLALGISANTTIFSVVEAVLLRSLPYRDASRLVWVSEVNMAKGASESYVAPPTFLDWQTAQQSFDAIAAFSDSSFVFTGQGEPERIKSASVSAAFFPMLGVQPIMGRNFTEEEDRVGARPVTIMSHALWRRRFNADPNIVGSAITLENKLYEVVGVVPPGFKMPANAEANEAELWTPLMPVIPDAQTLRGAHYLPVVGRLKEGSSPRQAEADLNAIDEHIAESDASYAGYGTRVVSLHRYVTGDVSKALLVLFAAVSFVLLIACSNVANLMLAQATARRREVAVRLALGASRGRLIRQMLTENMILAVLGGAMGLLMAGWAIDLLPRFAPAQLPRASEIVLDAGVIAFTVFATLITGLLFGLAPALQSTKLEFGAALKEGNTNLTAGLQRRRLLHSLVIAEMALTSVLLVGAGLMINSFARLVSVDPGFSPERVTTFQLGLPPLKYAEPNRQAAFYQDLVARIQTLPGTLAAGGSVSLPVNRQSMTSPLIIEGEPDRKPSGSNAVQYATVLGDYFSAMGIPVLQGRTFAEEDDERGGRVIVINAALARRFFPGESPIGKKIGIYFRNGRDREVIGVVGDARHSGLDKESPPQVFVPFGQNPSRNLNLVVRSDARQAALVAAVRDVVRSIDKDQPIDRVATMPELLSRSVAQPRFYTGLLTSFALIAFALAALGIYGVISYSVTQLTHELGIRIALGADPRDILKLVLGRGMALTLIGVSIGLVGSLALTRLMSGLLFGISPTDPATFVLATLLLSGVALVACYVPARRATRVDPMVALRYE